MSLRYEVYLCENCFDIEQRQSGTKYDIVKCGNLECSGAEMRWIGTCDGLFYKAPSRNVSLWHMVVMECSYCGERMDWPSINTAFPALHQHGSPEMNKISVGEWRSVGYRGGSGEFLPYQKQEVKA